METKPLTDDQKSKLTDAIIQAICDGAGFGIEDFVKNNNVNRTAGSKSKDPIGDFMPLLLAEFSGSPAYYPLKDSFRSCFELAAKECVHACLPLAQSGQVKEIEALCRVVGRGETVKFLDEHRIECVKLINDLRGD